MLTKRTVVILATSAAIGALIILPLTLSSDRTSTTVRPFGGDNSYQNITSAFERDDVDVSDLLTKIEPVRFDYRAAQPARNPMRPLVGVGLMGPDSGSAKSGGSALDDDERLYRAQQMPLTGIVWDRMPMAVLDGVLAWEGYRFDSGVAIKRIRKTEVILEVPQQDGDLELVKRFHPNV